MNSKRLPGKVLLKLDKKVLLEWTIERLRKNSYKIPVAVISSDKQSDKPIEEFCYRNKVLFYKGSLENVIKRFQMACQFFQEDFFIRVSGDSPLIDPKLIDKAYEIHCKQNFDLITNIMRRSFPKGQSVELISKNAINHLQKFNLSNEEKEHVTLGFYKNKDKFNIYNFESGSKKYALQQQSIDTLSDYLKIKNLIKSEHDVLNLNWLDIYFKIKHLKNNE
tara:strand:- start:473 stop:1135 length:663 start_codon:yes stop_codon:yes gene_type:complete